MSYPCVVTPQPLRAVLPLQVLFSPWAFGWAVGLQEKACLSGIYETMTCRKLILGRDIGWGSGCATSWRDLDLTFDLAIVTLSLKILSGVYLRSCEVYEEYTS